MLSRGWHAYKRSTGGYEEETEKGYCGLKCSMTLFENEYLDLDSPMFRDSILTTYVRTFPGRARVDTAAMSGFYDAFIKDVEKSMKTTFKVIAKRLAPPPSEHCPGYPYLVAGDPPCYVARDVSCISVLN
jgi:hypothetical protein